MAALIQAGEISSRELVKAHLERIEKINPRLNAAVEIFRDRALKGAAEADAILAKGGSRGALHGVPFSVKDSIDVAAARTTAGTWGRREAEPARAEAHRL